MFGLTRKKKAAGSARAQVSNGPKKPVTPTLPADLMRKVRRIEISTKKLVDEGIAGGYHSVFKGRGVEFSEVRPYQPGDDVRSIDWNVTARMGAPFIKQFVEERDLTVFIVVDVSGSLNFGSRSTLKRELAAEIAALLSFAALRNQDRVGAALVGERLELFLQPRRRRSHVLRMVREILVGTGGGLTDLDSAVAQTLRNLKQRSVLFLISDFQQTPFANALKRASARHDLVVIEITDPRDLTLPPVAAVPLRDAETGRIGLVDGRKLESQYLRRRGSERAQLHRISRQVGADLIHVSTDRPYMPELVAFFEQRRRRLSR